MSNPEEISESTGLAGGHDCPSSSPTCAPAPPSQLSPQKLAANRLNSQKSTGPRSPAGKQKSALNAQTHGLRSRLDPQTLVPKTDHQAYAGFLQDLRDNLAPTCPLEELLVERIALLGWKLRRHAQAEARLLDQANYRARENVERANRHATKKYEDQLAHHQRYNKRDTPPPPDLQPIPDPEPAAHLLARFAENPGAADAGPGAHSLELLTRYESATERAFYKALQQYHAFRAPPAPATAANDLHHHFHYHRHTATHTPPDPSPPPFQVKLPNEPTDFAITPPTTTTNANPSPSGTAPATSHPPPDVY